MFAASAMIAASIFAIAPVNVHAADSSDPVLLNTLGYTTGQSVLVTHMALGNVADAFVGSAYTADAATTFVNTYIRTTRGMKEQMSKLLAARTLGENDTKFIQRTMEVIDLVLKEAQDLKAYIVSRSNADATAYDSSRKSAWKEIKTLLGIKD